VTRIAFHDRGDTPHAQTYASLFVVASLFAGLVIFVGNAQQIAGHAKAVQLTGLTGVTDNTKGILSDVRTRSANPTRIS